MHARHHRWIVLTLMSTLSVPLGCRGTRPHESFVQVTKDQGVAVPELDAPQQRLAVNKPRNGGQNVVTDTKTHRLVSDQTESRPAATPPQRETVNMRLADHREPTTKPADEVKIPSQSQPAQSQPTAARESLTSDPIAAMTAEEMTAAFESQPEHIRVMALRQLTAAISRSAERTSQPAAVDAAIANSVDSLPELPADTGNEPAIPAARIAGAAPARGDSQPITSGSDTGTETGLEAVVVQSISDRSADSDVQPASASRDSAAKPMVTQASGEPDATGAAVSPVVSDLSDQALYEELLQRLAKEPLGESEADRNARMIKQRHLMVLAGNPDAAVEKVEAMSEAEQEYLRHQLLGLWTMVDPQGHPVPSRRFTTALPQMREATKFAAAATDSLDVRSLAFCTAIESYGQIKTFPGNRFDAGQQVILYCEIENFTVDDTSEGFQTHLQGSYDIFSADNEKVVSQLLPADKQVSANYLRDYFIAYQMHLPQQLSPGTYRLQLTMEDVSGKKYGQASIPLEIAK